MVQSNLLSAMLEAISGVYEAEADLENCFFQCGIDLWLSEYFCFDDN